MTKVFDCIDWMLQRHPILSAIGLILLAGNVSTLANFLVPPP